MNRTGIPSWSCRAALARRVGSTAATLTLLAAFGCASALAQPTPLDAQDRRKASLDQVPCAEATQEQASPDELDPSQRARLELARSNVQDGDFREAVEDLKALRESDHVENYDIDLLLGEAHMHLGDWLDALDAGRRALRYRPGSADAHVLIGTVHRRAGELEHALRHFRSATLAADRELNNDNITWAWRQLGVTLAEAGYLRAAEQSLAQFDKAVWQTHPEHRNAERIAEVLRNEPYGALLRRLELLRELDDDEARTRLTAEAMSRWENDAYVARLHIGALIDAGKPDQAFQACQPWLQSEDGRGAILDRAIEAGLASGRLDAWLEELADATNRDRGSAGVPQADRSLARAVLHHLPADAAPAGVIRLGRALLAQQPDAVDVMLKVAAAQNARSGFDAAFNTLVAFVRANPGSKRLTQPQIDAWRSIVDDREKLAGQFGRIAEQADGDDFAVSFALGLTALALGNHEQADRFLESARQSNPDFVPAYVVRAEALLARYDWSAALALADSLLVEHPKLAAAQFVRAEALNGLDRNREAETAYRRAINLAPEEASYRLALADHYRRLGNLLGAQRYYREALMVEPANDAAFEGLIESYLWSGKLEVARAELARLRDSGVSDDALRHVETHMRYINDSNPDAYLADLRQQHRQHPDDTKTARLLAGALMRTGCYDEAIDLLHETRRAAPQDYDLANLTWQTHQARAEFAEATGILEQLQKRYPNRLEVLRWLARFYLYDFQVQRGIQLLERLSDVDSDRKDEYRTLLFDSLLRFGRVQEALDLLGEQLNVGSPAAAAMVLRLPELLVRIRVDPDEAAATFRQATKWLDQQPGDVLRRELWVVTGIVAEQYDTLLPKVREWIEENPDNKREWTDRLIDILLAAEQFDAALQVARDFQGTWIDAIDMRLAMARCHAAAGRFDDAVEELQAVFRERAVPEERQWMARQRLILVLTDAGRFEQALHRCAEWLEAEGPGQGLRRRLLLTLKRRALQLAGREDDVLAVLEDLYEEQQTDPGLNNDLGYTWADRGRNLDQALEMIRFAVLNDPLNAAYLDSLGWVYYKLGRLEQARRTLRRAAQLREGRDPVIFDHLGDTLYRLGDVAEARREWETALDEVRKRQDDSERDLTPLDEQTRRAVQQKLRALDESGQVPIAPLGEEQPTSVGTAEPDGRNADDGE